MAKDANVDPELYQVFLVESLELLEKFNNALLDLEKNPEGVDTINELFRIAHTLKGTSGMVGLDDIKESMHAAEDLMDAVRAGKHRLEPAEFDLLFSLCDAVTRFLNEPDSTFSKADWVDQLRAPLSQGEKKDAGLPEPPLVLSELEKEQVNLLQEQGKIIYGFELIFMDEAPMRSVTAMVFTKTIAEYGEIFKTAPDKEDLLDENYCKYKLVCVCQDELTEDALDKIKRIKASNPGVSDISWRRWAYWGNEIKTVQKEVKVTEKTEKQVADTIRVDSEKLQKLLNTVGDLLSVRASLEETFESGTIFGPGMNSLKLQMHQFNQTLSILQTEVMQLRMVPIKQLFSRYPRIVRDLAHKNGKEVQLTFHGEDTEIDKKVMESLVDPLTHIIRNALDHGIERPEQRKACGKSPTGQLILSAAQEGNNIVIEIEDDGAGINPEKVLAKAIERGVAQAGKDYSEAEIIDFIFAPGFSTAEKITEISGRGVGLDVVRTNLTMLNGSVTVTTEKGKGSVFRLVVPLTLAIINAFLVKVDGQIFAIPAHDVSENIVIKPEDVHRVEGLQVVRLRNEVIPITDLGERFYNRPPAIGQSQPVVIVGNAQRKAAVLVDEFLEPREIMIKPVNPTLGTIKYVSGVTVLGNGQIGLILDVMPFLNREKAS